MAHRERRYPATADASSVSAMLEALAAALGGDITARLLAAQVLVIRRVLARANWQKLAPGRTADDVHSEAVADADRAFALFRNGIGA